MGERLIGEPGLWPAPPERAINLSEEAAERMKRPLSLAIGQTAPPRGEPGRQFYSRKTLLPRVNTGSKIRSLFELTEKKRVYYAARIL